MENDLQHLKVVSRVKHLVLQNYFSPWATILASQNSSLIYCDCFAGPGSYEYLGARVDGSPLIAVKSAIEFVNKNPNRQLSIFLIEDDEDQIVRLETGLRSLQPFPKSLSVKLEKSNSRIGVPQLLKSIPEHVPAFFLVDPYGHPLSVPVLNQILKRKKTEVLINLMWYRINMDLGNPLVQKRMTEFFGDDHWREQDFNRQSGPARERGFLGYFRSRLDCKYFLPFKLRYDPEDKSGGDRTKYYLIHSSNHIKALLLMKTVMWPLGDEEGTFDFSGESQGILISETPTEAQLAEILVGRFAGQSLRFDDLLENTWELPFTEKHFRSVLRNLEGSDVKITRVSSKKTGIKGDDRILFRSGSKDRL